MAARKRLVPLFDLVGKQAAASQVTPSNPPSAAPIGAPGSDGPDAALPPARETPRAPGVRHAGHGGNGQSRPTHSIHGRPVLRVEAGPPARTPFTPIRVQPLGGTALGTPQAIPGAPVDPVEVLPRPASAVEAGAAALKTPGSVPPAPTRPSVRETSAVTVGFPAPRRWSATAVSLAAFAIILTGVTAWFIAFRLGAGSRERELAAHLRAPAPAVQEVSPTPADRPLIQPPPLLRQQGQRAGTLADGASRQAAGDSSRSAPSQATPARSEPQPAPSRQAPQQRAAPAGIQPPFAYSPEDFADPPRGFVITGRGFAPADPRSPGLNYLHLATLSRHDAGPAVLFLAANGVEAFAVPVMDTARDGSRIPSTDRYTVIAGPGITRDQFRGNTPEKTGLEARVAELGAAWRTQFRGATDFRSPGWYRYTVEE